MFPLLLVSFKPAFQTAVLFLPSVVSLLGFLPSVLFHFHSFPSKLFPLARALIIFPSLHSSMCCFLLCLSLQSIFFPLPRTFYSSNTFPLSLWPIVICIHWHATIFCPNPVFTCTLGTTLPSIGREQGEWLRDVVLAEEDVEVFHSPQLYPDETSFIEQHPKWALAVLLLPPRATAQVRRKPVQNNLYRLFSSLQVIWFYFLGCSWSKEIEDITVQHCWQPFHL